MSIQFPRATLLIADSPISGAVTELVRGAGGEVIPCSADLGSVSKLSGLTHPGLAVISCRSGSAEECATLVQCLGREGTPVILVLDGDEESEALFARIQKIAPTAYTFFVSFTRLFLSTTYRFLTKLSGEPTPCMTLPVTPADQIRVLQRIVSPVFNFAVLPS